TVLVTPRPWVVHTSSIDASWVSFAARRSRERRRFSRAVHSWSTMYPTFSAKLRWLLGASCCSSTNASAISFIFISRIFWIVCSSSIVVYSSLGVVGPLGPGRVVVAAADVVLFDGKRELFLGLVVFDLVQAVSKDGHHASPRRRVDPKRAPASGLDTFLRVP